MTTRRLPVPASPTNPRIDWFFEKDTPWKAAYATLRPILLESGLTEQMKWGCPCYTLDGKNVVLIHGFKDYCALLFFKGALLADAEHLLVRQTENVQSARQLRFGGAREITRQARVVRAYVREAMQVERAGLTVTRKSLEDYVMPEEFATRLQASPALKKAFESLTPGRQRGYLLHFSSAAQSRTRQARVERHVPRILVGKGLDD